MVRTYKRKSAHNSWTMEQLNEATASVRQGQMTLGEAAGKYAIPKTTIHRHLRATLKRTDMAGPGRCPVLSPEFEGQLTVHIKEMQRLLFGLTSKDVRRIAFQLAERNRIKHPFSKKTQMAGEDWFLSFCKRHPDLSVRRPEATSINRAIGFNVTQVNAFYDVLKTELQKSKIDACRIWNVDESGLTSVHKPPKIVALRGLKQVGKLTSAERGKTITVVCCFNAAGNYIPPAMIFPRKNMVDRLLKGAPPGSIGLTSKSGWINEDIFILWLKHFVRHVRPSVEQKHVIILDGHASHKTLYAIDIARENGVVLMCLPPHTTHRLQPLDLVFYGPLKTAYNLQADNFMTSNPGIRITDYDVAEIFGHAYSKVANVDKGRSGFERAGIFPFNSAKFGPDDFATLGRTTDGPKTCATVVVEDNVPVVAAEETFPAEAAEDIVSAEPDRPIEQSTPTDEMNITPISTFMPTGFNPERSVGHLTTDEHDYARASPLKPVNVLDISPLPHLAPRKAERKRIPERAKVLTSTPVRAEIELKHNAKKKTKKSPQKKRSKVALGLFAGQKGNSAVASVAPYRRASWRKNETRKSQGPSCTVGLTRGDSDIHMNDVFYCIYCNEKFVEPPTDPWVQCSVCLKWCHEACVLHMAPPFSANFACVNCVPKRTRH